MERYIFHFPYYYGTRSFGPYATEIEAKAAYQRAYGFWPQDATKQEAYHVSTQG